MVKQERNIYCTVCGKTYVDPIAAQNVRVYLIRSITFALNEFRYLVACKEPFLGPSTTPRNDRSQVEDPWRYCRRSQPFIFTASPVRPACRCPSQRHRHPSRDAPGTEGSIYETFRSQPVALKLIQDLARIVCKWCPHLKGFKKKKHLKNVPPLTSHSDERLTERSIQHRRKVHEAMYQVIFQRTLHSIFC